jgi:hypothetical protein
MTHAAHSITYNSNPVAIYDTDIIAAIRNFPGSYSEPVTTLSPSGSPYIWKNTSSLRLAMSITGGTVSDISVQRFSDTGFNSLGRTSVATLYLNPGDTIKVTYSVAPTITFQAASWQS